MGMQLQMIGSPPVQFASANDTAATAWRRARATGAAFVMVREAQLLFMIRREELERFAAVEPHSKLALLPLHSVGVASPMATIRQLEAQLQSSGVETIAMIRADQVLAVLSRETQAGESPSAHGVLQTSRMRSAA
jgi:hypothetical protein